MSVVADITVLDTVARLGAAASFGAVVGFEREVDGHDAGVRTHLLLSVGAAMFGLVSVGGFDHFMTGRNATNITIDPTRIASYVAAGVGFLGGGAIVKGDDRVRGLTTAASLWVVASIGLAAGLGFWAPAVVCTALATIALLADRPLRRLAERLRHHDERRATSPR
jgi:putative Mg2+ transporter-C (MgtC) family protein